MSLICRRLLSVHTNTRKAVSNVKWKLQKYLETGQLQRASARELNKERARTKALKVRSSFEEGISLQKALILIKSRYDGALIPDAEGKLVDLQSLSPNSLKINDPRLLQLFQALMKIKKIQKRKIDDRILMTLTGVTRALLQDSYFVAQSVSYLLEKDNAISRAMEVCRLAGKNGSVGINAVLDWCLKRSKLDLALKVLADRGRWGIPLTPATYVTYFSGLSDCHEWGLVSDLLAKVVTERFKENKVTRNVETFNAALKLLMKNFNDDQIFAWQFFETLEHIKLRPDAQTFTIFLQGLKTLYKRNVETVQKDSSISSQERAQKLFQLQALLVLRANMVLTKAMTFATPPTPPTTEAVIENPRLLVDHKKKIRQPFLDIDRHFAVAFLLCYCDSSAGTSWANKSGSHYWYLQRALDYLQAWVPEASDIINFTISSSTQGSMQQTHDKKRQEVIIAVSPSKEVEARTDQRTQSLDLTADIKPQMVTGCKQFAELNPKVVFPLSPFSSHQDKLYMGKDRRLIDFARVRASALYKEYFEYQARVQKAKGRLAPKRRSHLKPDNQGINKFLLRILLDCLARLGLHKEFYRAMWYSILTWGGIKIDPSRLRIIDPSSTRAATESMYPVIESLLERKKIDANHESSAQVDVIDIGLVEDFIHKIEEHIPQILKPSSLAVEVLAVFSNRSLNHERALWPRPSTFNAIFALLNRDIYRYNDRNLTLGHRTNNKLNVANNTAKLSINFDQLCELLDSLDILVRSIFARFGGKSMERRLLQSYDILILRIYSMTWNGAPENHENAVTIHKKIIRSGVLMYKPRHLIDRRQDHAYSEVTKRSFDFVHDKLTARSNLQKDEVDLMMSLRNLSNFEKSKEGTEAKFEELQMSIYKLTKCARPVLASQKTP